MAAPRLDYVFRDPRLLAQALRHRSYSADHNERLEFLGDGVLNCVIAHALYRRFPDMPEGDLSRFRATLVNQRRLAELAEGIGMGDALLLGEGERRSGGRGRPSILADGLEALFGAVFLDGGYAAAEAVITGLFTPVLDGLDPTVSGKDPKTQLQEHLQARKLALPQYQIVATSGRDHEQQFEVTCRLPGCERDFNGRGPSRRTAEQVAARAAIAWLESGGAMSDGRGEP